MDTCSNRWQRLVFSTDRMEVHRQEIYSKGQEDAVIMQTNATPDEADLAFRVYKMLDGNEAFSNMSEFHVMPIQGEDGTIVSVQVSGIQRGDDSESGTLHTQVFDIHELGDILHLPGEPSQQEREELCMDAPDDQPVSPAQCQDVSQETDTPETARAEPEERAEPEQSTAEQPVATENTVTKTLYSCGQCKFSSCNLAALRRHMRRHSDKHKCKLCEKTFASATELRLHVNFHLGIKPHKCSECDMAYGTAADLLRHTRSVHSLEKPYQCCYCDYASAEVSRMKIHIRSHTGERPFTCTECSFASTDAFKLRRHIRTHTGEKPYSCNICQAKFTQRNSMKMHILRKHTENLPKERCPICSAALFGKHDIQVHIRKQHTYLETPVKCRFCPETFHERYSLRQHQQSHRNEKQAVNRPGIPNGKGEVAIIDEQDAETGSKENHLTWNILPSSEETQLFVHLDGSEQPGTELHSIPMQVEDGSIVQALVVHSTDQVDTAELHAQVYELQDLGAVLQPLMEQQSSSGSIVIAVNSTMDQSILNELEQDVNPNSSPQEAEAVPSPQASKRRRLQLINPENQIEVKLHKCKECNKSFSTGLELVKHKKSHKPENQFKCPFCEHETTEAEELILHIQIHSEDRPFHCDQCNYATTDAFKLTRHKRTHTGERPFSCSVCQITFTQKSTMEMHVLRKHTKELPKLHCPLCETVLTGKVGLKIHIRRQHSQTEKALKCRFCPATFHERFVLRQHQKVHQKEKTVKSNLPRVKRKVVMRNNNKQILLESERSLGPQEETFTWQVVPAEQETEIHFLISGSEEIDALSEYHVLPVQTEAGSFIGIQVAGLQEVEQVDAGTIHTQLLLGQDVLEA
ncbi:zinc finger protein 271-like isoform X2 [Bufo bufo]|uniref:zinc finger protein 271-like isoform X2 n=1 Tax=Bufo bufo TaxID=8384 RepID=UPI001ABEA93D|nr:zinc finger protein 271-like isoform X2 [Bufo bufo]